MLKNLIILCVLLSCATSSSQSSLDSGVKQGVGEDDDGEISKYFNAAWAMDTLWDDGLAEVAVYEAERVVYGKKRDFDYTLITVKEEFNKEQNVKTDDYSRNDLFPVMKISQFCRIPTENYPYHYLTSVFVHRERPWALHKLTSTSQEWCGNTFKAITDKGDHYNQYYNTYFDGQGEGNRQIRQDLLLEDQLTYSLRSLNFQDNLSFETDVLETQQTNKADDPVIYKNALVSGRNIMLNNVPAWEVEVRLDKNKTNRYWFAKTYPNQLLQQETWDGRNLKLKNISRYAYWQD